VTTAVDVVNPTDGLTSLREAIACANSHPGPDTIILDPAVFGSKRRTITLKGGPLVVTDPATTTIIGPGASLLAISGGGNDIVVAGDGLNTVTLGDGNHHVLAGDGKGNDHVLLGNGSDVIVAGNGADLVVGGLGEHTILVGNGNDILIDGSATVVDPGDSFRQILSDWNSSSPASVDTRLKVVYNTTDRYVARSGDRTFFTWGTTGSKPIRYNNSSGCRHLP
jgi:Ca2+-binding RTX toxin-like protein